MPELPDVEAARRLVEDAATGAPIHTVACPDPSALRNTTLRRFRHAVIGRHVRSTDAPGKVADDRHRRRLRSSSTWA